MVMRAGVSVEHPADGARDLRNLIRKEVEDKIANAIVESHTGLISSIKVTTEGEPAEAVKLEITE